MTEVASSYIQPTAGITQTPVSTAFAGTEGIYLLPHHAKEIERLQKQHLFMNSSTGGILLLTPNAIGESPLKVLDAGAADGTWLRDLPRQLSHRRLSLHGVDIGEALFPNSNDRMVDLKQHNVTQPFPQSFGWQNSFDIIHQRLLIWGIKSTEWVTVLRNYFDILKPGGYLQLVEAEWINPSKPVELPQLRKQAILQKWSTEQFGMDIDIAYRLEDYLRSAGFDHIQKVQFDHGYGAKAKDTNFANPSAELWVECFRSLDTKLDAEGIPGVATDSKEFHEFLDALEVEIKTYGYQPKLNFVYGRKPL